MTPWDELKAVQWHTLQSMSAGNLLQLLEQAGLTHAIVVEANRESSLCVVRAVASRARLLRQLKSLRR
jgi:hypothetical protein